MKSLPARSAARSTRLDLPDFQELYRQHAPMVHALLVARVEIHTAEDLMQEVFLAAWKALDQLEDREKFGAWLAAITCNRLRRHWQRSRPPAAQIPEGMASPPEPESPEAILAVIRSLPEAYAESLSLRLIEGLKGPEIARLTGKTEGSVRVHLTRGMKMLREKLQRENRDE